MNITNLELNNFRNYTKLEIKFSKKFNILIGGNANGKTNILESIYLICTTRSFRNTNEYNFIKLNEEIAKIYIGFEENGIKKNLAAIYEANGRKSLFVNCNRIKRSSDFIGNLKSIILTPEDIFIIKGDSSLRRKFMDLFLCQVDRLYMESLIIYLKIIKYRNLILRNIKLKKSDRNELEPWNLKMLETVPYIVEKRNEFINKLNKYANVYNEMLSDNYEKLNIEYIDSIKKINEVNHDINAYKSYLQIEMEKVSNEEIKRGISMIGPHRDELIFKINDTNLKYFGSQGQQRTTVISLRLAEAEIMKAQASDTPVLLVDDIFSELDDSRRNHLLNLLQGFSQVFMTGTNLADFSENISKDHSKIFHIKEGKIINLEQK